mmetsp:Transcript_27438/g.39284  ORF Transcript_27438/g.39284 Transcript_27438/m.39284 type:complete len:551 (+) Transcript_27438:128-1780(+)
MDCNTTTTQKNTLPPSSLEGEQCLLINNKLESNYLTLNNNNYQYCEADELRKMSNATESTSITFSTATIEEAPEINNTLTYCLGNSRKLGLRKLESSFWSDATDFEEGTIPHSIVLALTIGIVNGVVAFLYYKCLFYLLQLLWHDLPQKFVVGTSWNEHLYVLWIPIVGLSMSLGVGLSFRFLGDPKDLAYIVRCVHEQTYVPIAHALPMLIASQFSILGGASLGPEAPLVAICAAVGGFISRHIFKTQQRNSVRKHTLMGMASALSAFFGCPLGGGLFALEVNNRLGMEYYEHAVEVIFCGVVGLTVFRGLSGLPIGPIYDLQPTLPQSDAFTVVCGALIGLLGASLAVCFSHFHWHILKLFESYRLMEAKKSVQRSLAGGLAIVTIGMILPHTMFWGEMEFKTIVNLAPAKSLEHVFPTSGLIGFEMNSCASCLLVGLAKLVAISFSVAGGFRGGFIFPLFAAGAAFGRAFTFVCPSILMLVSCLCFACSINVAITRTALSTPIILIYLCAQQNAIGPVLAASLVSLFATYYTPFITSQVPRSLSFFW